MARICAIRARARALFSQGSIGTSNWLAADTRHSSTRRCSAMLRASLLSGGDKRLSMLKPAICATTVSPRCMILDNLRQLSRRSVPAESRQALSSGANGGMISEPAIPIASLRRAKSDGKILGG